MLSCGIRKCSKMCRWEKLGMTAREVEENEPGSRDKEYRCHFQGVFLMETENCSLSFYSYKSYFNLFYTDGNDPA